MHSLAQQLQSRYVHKFQSFFGGGNCCVKLILNKFSLLFSDVFKELQKLNKSHISMCLHENYLDSAG